MTSPQVTSDVHRCLSLDKQLHRCSIVSELKLKPIRKVRGHERESYLSRFAGLSAYMGCEMWVAAT